jgi:hypothetical protein
MGIYEQTPSVIGKSSLYRIPSALLMGVEVRRE